MIYQGEQCYGVIYLLTNTVNGMRYVGQTVDLQERWKHYRNLNCKGQRHLYAALVKYGVEAFTFEVIHVAYSKEQLDWLECWFIEELHTMTNGYNLKSGGSRGLHSEESKVKMSAYWTGRNRVPPSQETRKRIGDAQRGLARRKHTQAEKNAISAKLKGKAKPDGFGIGSDNNFSRPVVCITTGITYACVKDAANATGTSRSSISNNLTNRSHSAGKLANGTKLQWMYA